MKRGSNGVFYQEIVGVEGGLEEEMSKLQQWVRKGDFSKVASFKAKNLRVPIYVSTVETG